jgi:hypothetical protein
MVRSRYAPLPLREWPDLRTFPRDLCRTERKLRRQLPAGRALTWVTPVSCREGSNKSDVDRNGVGVADTPCHMYVDVHFPIDSNPLYELLRSGVEPEIEDLTQAQYPQH